MRRLVSTFVLVLFALSVAVVSAGPGAIDGVPQTLNRTPMFNKSNAGAIEFNAPASAGYSSLFKVCKTAAQCAFTGYPALWVENDSGVMLGGTNDGNRLRGVLGLRLGTYSNGNVSVGMEGAAIGSVFLTPSAGLNVSVKALVAGDDTMSFRAFPGGAAAPFDFLQTTADITGSSKTATWQNWSGNFTGNYDSDDGVFTVLAEALANIGFETPIPIPGHKEGGKGSYKIYCRYTTQKGLKRCARAGNQQVGYDINNDVTIDGIPFTWVPSMDDAVINDSAGTAISATKTLAGNGHPIYIIDHSVLHAVVNKRNGLIRISPPTNANTGGHDKFAVFYDMMFNFICVDRRRCAALRGDISIA